MQNEGGNAGGNVIPPVQQVVEALPVQPVVVTAPAQTTMTAQCSMKDVLKCNGENFTDYEHEFLGIMEQLGLKEMLVAPTGGVVDSMPAEVIILFLFLFLVVSAVDSLAWCLMFTQECLHTRR